MEVTVQRSPVSFRDRTSERQGVHAPPKEHAPLHLHSWLSPDGPFWR